MASLKFELSHEVEDQTITIKAHHGNEMIGELYAGLIRQGKLKALNLIVNPKFRRQGVATAMYVEAERIMKAKFTPGTQSKDAKKLWKQKNRPFGESISSDDVIKFLDSVSTEGDYLDNQYADITQFDNWRVQQVPIDRIDFGPENVSDPHSQSLVKKYSKLKTKAPPIILIPSETEENMYRVVDGYHRVAVASNRGEKTIEAYVPYSLTEAKKSDLTFRTEDDEDGFTIIASKDGKDAGNVFVLLEYVGGGGDCYPFEPYEDQPFYDEICDHENVVSIQHLKVEKEFQGQGIATELMKKSAKEIKKRWSGIAVYINASPMDGPEGISLENLISFYQKFGFKVLKKYPEHRNALLWKESMNRLQQDLEPEVNQEAKTWQYRGFPMGIIDGRNGKFHRCNEDEGQTHEDLFQETGAPWDTSIRLGGAGYPTVDAEMSVLNNPKHPANKTLRDILKKESAVETFEVSSPTGGGIKKADAEFFIKYGRIKLALESVMDQIASLTETIKEARLKDWEMINVGNQPALTGRISGHPKIKDGKTVVTSPIIDKQDNIVHTASGTEYELESREDWKKKGIQFTHKEIPEMYNREPTGNVEHEITATGSDGNVAGVFEFFYWGDPNSPQHLGTLDVQSSNVSEKYQRIGVATEAYRMIEKITGAKLSPQPNNQTAQAQALWKQKDRPFGESREEGPQIDDFLQSRIHAAFTKVADDLCSLGYMDSEQRIKLSSAIGDSLEAFRDAMDEKCPWAKEVKVEPGHAGRMVLESIEPLSDEKIREVIKFFLSVDADDFKRGEKEFYQRMGDTSSGIEFKEILTKRFVEYGWDPGLSQDQMVELAKRVNYGPLYMAIAKRISPNKRNQEFPELKHKFEDAPVGDLGREMLASLDEKSKPCKLNDKRKKCKKQYPYGYGIGIIGFGRGHRGGHGAGHHSGGSHTGGGHTGGHGGGHH